jgi:hypothetical protein
MAAKISRVRTVVVSDLHLGLRAGGDLGRRPDVRARLVDLLAGADRLVLLGDVLELRERSLDEALELARPLFEELAGALGPGEIVLVPGNHDHALVAPLAKAHGGPDRLRLLEQRWAPPPGHPLGRLAGQLGPTRFELAYPGLWLDENVYATHGHYMDAHSPVPMVECLAIALSARLRGGPPAVGSSPADYERILTPVYRLSQQTGRRQSLGRGGAGDISVRLYERMTRRAADAETGKEPQATRDGATASSSPAALGSGLPPRPEIGDRLVRAAIPPAVDLLNRLGLGPFNADVSGSALRRAGLVAMGEVVRRLDIRAEHVVFGHTHRPGPLPRDLGEWTLPAEGDRGPTRLMNTGSWVYAPLFLGARPSDSPYWPGRCVVVEEGRPPELLHPLADSDHTQLAHSR